MTDRIDPELKKILTSLLLKSSMTEGKPPTMAELVAMAEHERRHREATERWLAAGDYAVNPSVQAPESVAITSAVLTRPEVDAILSALYAYRVELLREFRKAPDSKGYKDLLDTNDSAIRKLNGLRVPTGGHVSFED